jgi:alginate O-acetyltransferase complex protein AlgI
MLFNSLHYLIFLHVVLFLLAMLRDPWAKAVLFLASCYFYMVFSPVYILILFFLILVDYGAGLAMEAAPRHKKSVLILSLVCNFGVLAFFKYINFLLDSFAQGLGFFGWSTTSTHLDIILPIGLSFHTFQSVSYTIEVYRGAQRAERNLLIYAIYVMFFPQLVAGPIERPQNILPQLHKPISFEWHKITTGLQLILWGFFKKMVVADRWGDVASFIYKTPEGLPGYLLWLGTFAFAIQIYCDFSGYSDIARGSARLMGIDLMKNFDHPYCSQTISEFWRRWHISLSTWFRDYLYRPLGGSRGPRWKTMRNLMITFLVSGLWHGANWTYVMWGGLNGLYLIFGQMTLPWRNLFWQKAGLIGYRNYFKPVRVLVVFGLILISWVYFRATSITQAHAILYGMFFHPFLPEFRLPGVNLPIYAYLDLSFPQLYALGFDMLEWFYAISSLAILFLVEYTERNWKAVEIFRNWHTPLRWTTVYALLAITLLTARAFLSKEFIYFQF